MKKELEAPMVAIFLIVTMYISFWLYTHERFEVEQEVSPIENRDGSELKNSFFCDHIHLETQNMVFAKIEY